MGMYIGTTAGENNLADSQKIKHETYGNNFSTRYLFKRNENVFPRKTCTQVFIAVLLIQSKVRNNR